MTLPIDPLWSRDLPPEPYHSGTSVSLTSWGKLEPKLEGGPIVVTKFGEPGAVILTIEQWKALR